MHERSEPRDLPLNSALRDAARAGQAHARPASPVEIRTRANRRRRRRTALTVAGAVAAVVAGSGAVSALTSGPAREVDIRPADTESPRTPSPSASVPARGKDPLQAALLTAADLRPVYGSVPVPEQSEAEQGHLALCQPKQLETLGPEAIVHRDFGGVAGSPVNPVWTTHQSVLAFGTEDEAKRAVNTVRTWMNDCSRRATETIFTGRDPVKAHVSRRAVPAADGTSWRVDYDRNPLDQNIEYVAAGRRGTLVTVVLLSDLRTEDRTVEPWPATLLMQRALERAG
jgi:hypothetical protein